MRKLIVKTLTSKTPFANCSKKKKNAVSRGKSTRNCLRIAFFRLLNVLHLFFHSNHKAPGSCCSCAFWCLCKCAVDNLCRSKKRVLLLLLLRSRCAIELSKQSTRIKCNSFVPAALSLSLLLARAHSAHFALNKAKCTRIFANKTLSGRGISVYIHILFLAIPLSSLELPQTPDQEPAVCVLEMGARGYNTHNLDANLQLCVCKCVFALCCVYVGFFPSTPVPLSALWTNIFLTWESILWFITFALGKYYRIVFILLPLRSCQHK
jgi:hypothetical protein